MGIKNKLAKLAGENILEKISSSGSIDNMINSVMDKIDKNLGIGNANDYVKNVKSKYHLIIKSRSYSVGTIAGALTGVVLTDDLLGRYQVYDGDGVLKYRSDAECNMTNRDILDIYDAEDKRIGCVKEWLVSVGIPLFEKEVKKCTVKYAGNKICDLKKYVSFDGLEFEVLDGAVKIKYDDDGKEFTLNYKGKKIAQLHTVPIRLKDGYTDKFVMEYDSLENEAIAVLIAIAIDLIN